MTFKEESFFAESAALGIVGRMSAADTESRRAHLDYVLIHELGHILDQVLGDDDLGGAEHIARLRQVSWPRTDACRDLRLVPYADIRGDPPLGDGDAEPLYDVIAASSFPSLTAAMSAGEDFADSLAIYAHDVLFCWGAPGRWRSTARVSSHVGSSPAGASRAATTSGRCSKPCSRAWAARGSRS